MDYQAPKTFAEYMERHPAYHRMWLTKHCPWIVFRPEYEDVCQYLLLETLRKKRVEKYDSVQRTKNSRNGKDSPGLFLNWMARCFSNDVINLWKRGQSGSRKANQHTVSIQEIGVRVGEGHDNNEEGVVGHSQSYRLRAEREGDVIVVQAQIAQFRAFVEKHRPDLLPALDNITATSNEDLVSLRTLAQHMADGRTPNRKRRPYKPRPRKRWDTELTAGVIAECAAKGMKAKEVTVLIGSHDSYVSEFVRRQYGMGWKDFVRLRASIKAM